MGCEGGGVSRHARHPFPSQRCVLTQGSLGCVLRGALGISLLQLAAPPFPRPLRGPQDEAPSPGAWVPSNQVPKLPKDVATDLHHVLMTGWGLEGLWGSKRRQDEDKDRTDRSPCDFCKCSQRDCGLRN